MRQTPGHRYERGKHGNQLACCARAFMPWSRALSVSCRMSDRRTISGAEARDTPGRSPILVRMIVAVRTCGFKREAGRVVI